MDPTLYIAATQGNIEVLKTCKEQLLSEVASPENNTVLHVIAQYTDSEDAIREILSGLDSILLEKLLTWKNAEGETALYIASRNRRKLIVQQLLKSAGAVSSPDLEDGDGVVVSLAARMARISNKYRDTPLHEAVNNKDVAIVTLLVKADPDYKHLPNDMDKTPLYMALEKCATPSNRRSSLRALYLHWLGVEEEATSSDLTLEAILEFCKSPGIEGPHGETVLHAAARIKATSKWNRRVYSVIRITKNIQDEQGFTPLHFAAYFDNYRDVECLLQIDKSMAYMSATKDKHDCMTPLHIAASKGHEKVIQRILANCQNCWNKLTSKGQNILHLAAQGQHTKCIKLIVKQPWAINLLNTKDNDGNTPSHLLLSSIPKDYKSIKPLLEDPNVNVDAFNKKHSIPFEMFEDGENEFTTKKIHILKKLKRNFGRIEKVPWTIAGPESRSSKEKDDKKDRLEELNKNAQMHLLVAALIATVTFAAGFTLPGGYDGNAGPNQGAAVLIKKAAFKAFIVTDTIALISSSAAIFLHFTATLYKNDEAKISNRYSAALLFLIIAMISMAITFVTGLYVVLEKSREIAITVCVIGCLGIVFLLYLIRKVYRDMGFLVDEYIYIILLLVPYTAVSICVGTIVVICSPIIAILRYIIRKVTPFMASSVSYYCGKKNKDLVTED